MKYYVAGKTVGPPKTTTNPVMQVSVPVFIKSGLYLNFMYLLYDPHSTLTAYTPVPVADAIDTLVSNAA